MDKSKPIGIAALGFSGELGNQVMGLLAAVVRTRRDAFELKPAAEADFLIVNAASGVAVPKGKLVANYYRDFVGSSSDSQQLVLKDPIDTAAINTLLSIAERALNKADQHAVSNLNDASAKLGVVNELDLRALVVDDSAAVRTQIVEALRKAGVDSVTAASGEEALAKLKAERFELVFLDIVMPGIDGLEACRQIRSGPGGADVTIIMLTGQSAPSTRVQGALSGCDAFLTKPIDLKSFYAAIDKAVSKRAELRGVPISGLQARGFGGLMNRLKSMLG